MQNTRLLKLKSPGNKCFSCEGHALFYLTFFFFVYHLSLENVPIIRSFRDPYRKETHSKVKASEEINLYFSKQVSTNA